MKQTLWESKYYETPIMPINKATQNQQAQKEALKLFAAGYSPLLNIAYPRIGKFNFPKIYRRFGTINPVILYKCAGVHAYTIDRHDIQNDVYHALYRLCKNKTPSIYIPIAEKYNEKRSISHPDI